LHWLRVGGVLKVAVPYELSLGAWSDPTHVRDYSEEEWRGLFEGAGLDVEAAELVDTDIDLEAWLARAGCEGDEAERVKALLADRVRDGRLAMTRIALKGRKRATG